MGGRGDPFCPLCDKVFPHGDVARHLVDKHGLKPGTFKVIWAFDMPIVMTGPRARPWRKLRE
jgi:hypothetical protein